MSPSDPPSGPPPDPSGAPLDQPTGRPMGPPAGPSFETPQQQQHASARSTQTGSRSPWMPVAVVLGALAVVLVGFLVFAGDDDEAPLSGATDDTALSGTSTTGSFPTGLATTTTAVGTTLAGVPGEIFLEPNTGVGPIPFTPSVDATAPDVARGNGGEPLAPTAPFPSDTLPPPPVAGGVVAISGDRPGLYGGTRSNTTCDKEKLVQFLEANEDKATAWASVQKILPSDIRAFISALTSVLLRTDTRVTNYGFANGTAPARQVVLQAGTAVLVDNFGVPRVRCFCGNPLSEPRPEPAPTYTGAAWPGFVIVNVTVVAPAATQIDVLVLVDVATAQPFNRPVGSDGAVDVPAAPDVLTATTTTLTPTTTAAPTTTSPATTTTVAATTTTVAVPVDIAPQGSVEASSVFPGNEFPAGLATDLDPTSSWFSAGPGRDGTTVFRWTAPDGQPVQIASITIVSNALHPDFPTNFGFGSVTIDVQDPGGGVVFSQTLQLAGTPDPTVTVTPNVRGSIVNLTFRGHEALDCGGFAELQVLATP